LAQPIEPQNTTKGHRSKPLNLLGQKSQKPPVRMAFAAKSWGKAGSVSAANSPA
jgi:hypothetical protein